MPGVGRCLAGLRRGLSVVLRGGLAVVLCLAVGEVSAQRGSGGVPAAPRGATATPRLTDAGGLTAYLERAVVLDLFPGVIVAQVSPADVTYTAAGVARRDGQVPTPQTLFPLGEVSGVLTVAATFELVAARQLGWNSRLAAFLPASVAATLPVFGEEEIRLRHLAAQTSGFPRLPPDWVPREPTQPFNGYDEAALLASLTQLPPLVAAPGAIFEPSVFGMGTLGYVVATRQGRPLAEVVAERVMAPLRLADLTFSLSEAQRARCAEGFAGEEAVPAVEMGALVGAAGAWGSAEALAQFLRAAGLWQRSPLGRTFQQMQNVVSGTPWPQTTATLGWHLTTSQGEELFWVVGKSAAQSAFIGFSRAGQRGVVILANGTETLEPLGFHLLQPAAFPLPPLPLDVAVGPSILARHAGLYRTEAGNLIRVRHADGRLLVQVDDLPTYRVYARDPLVFAYRHGGATLHFSPSSGPSGVSPGLVLKQGAQALPAVRVVEAGE